MAEARITREPLAIRITTARLELRFSTEDGGLNVLRLDGGANLLGHGESRSSVDVQVGLEGTWLGERTLVRYLRCDLQQDQGTDVITIVIGIGPLMLFDTYRIIGTWIERQVRVQNVSDDEIQLRAVRLMLPWVCPGELELCRFEAPGNSVRPRVPMSVAAALRRDVLPRRFFAPGLREGRALELAPISGPGLLAAYNLLNNETLLCWFSSVDIPAQPHLEGNDQAVTFIHELGLASRLGSMGEVEGGVQHILLTRESWKDAMRSFRDIKRQTEPLPLAVPAAWVYDAALYEVHPAEFGGFHGLITNLPKLRAMGINTLLLLPIWAFANKSGQLWDGDWRSSGDPYALLDLEQIDPTLGSATDLQGLVDHAHNLGMRVLVDLPLIGAAPESRYHTEHPNWFCQDETGHPMIAMAEGEVMRFDWANEELRDYLIETAVAHMQYFGFDGYRGCVSRHPTPNWARSNLPRASTSSLAVIGVLHELDYALKEHHPEALVFSSLSGPGFQTVAGFGCDELPHHHFFHMALGRVTPSELAEWLSDHWSVLPSRAARACFVESHSTYLLNPLANGMRGSKLSRMLLAGMSFCGFTPLITYGQELSDAQFITQLLQMWAEYPTLRYGDIRFDVVPCDTAEVFTVYRSQGGTGLIGLLHVSAQPRVVTLSIPVDLMNLTAEAYTVVDLLQGAPVQHEGQSVWQREELLTLKLQVAPYLAACLSLHPYEPVSPIAVSSDSEALQLA